MKLNIIAALLLCASVATAASETTTTATTTTTSATSAAPAKAKKAKKKAKKDEKKDGAQVAPASTPAQAQVAPAAVAPAAAAATSTAVAPATAAPAKKWGVTMYVEPSVDYAGGKDLANAPISTTNYVGASYKITDKEKVGLRQYYTYTYEPHSGKDFESSDIAQSFTAATISTKTSGILGSDDIAPMFWYYLPGHMAEETNFGKDMDNFYGILRADAEINWTLNPKWSVSYYLNPRQTLGAKDEEANFEASTRLVHYANVYYNVSDATQIYANVGFDNRMSTAKLTSTKDDYLSAVGIYMTFFGGKLAVNPEINVTTNLKKNGVAAREQELYKKENIGYLIGTAISL